MVVVFDGAHGRGEVEYMAWAKKNSSGFIVQSRRDVNKSCLVLHKSCCGTITKKDRADGIAPFTGGRTIKTCAISTEELVKHFASLGFSEFSKCCSQCKPTLPVWPTRIGVKSTKKSLPTKLEAAAMAERRWRAVLGRDGAPKFRRALMEAYGGRCAATGCRVSAVLEAAHVVPYARNGANDVTNGLLLRADIHTLFDLGYLTVGSDRKWIVAPALDITPYNRYHGRLLREPKRNSDKVDRRFFQWHQQNIFLIYEAFIE